MKKIKVKLEGVEHSAGRGVGFYRTHLAQALEKLNEVDIVTTGSDLVHYPYFDLFYPTLPQHLPLPTVVTIHDLTPIVLSNFYPQGFRARLALAAQRTALKNVAAIITDSQSSKKDLINIFKLNPENIHVTPLASDPIYNQKPSSSYIKSIKEKYHLPERFILYVGGVNANKNLVRLTQAAVKLNTPIVFVGSEFIKTPVETFSVKKLLGLQKIHPETKEFEKLKEIISGNPLFFTLGFVPADELNAIYRLATLYCQPSLYEGFGLPLLEAMSAGCLVVSSQTSSLPEILPSEALVFDPTNLEEMESVINRAISLSAKEKEKMIALGQKKAAEFTWEKTAKATLAVYQAVLQGKV